MTARARGAAAALAGAAAVLSACSTPGAAAPARAPSLIAPDGDVALPEFTAEEQARPVALRTLRTTDAASYHVVRLSKAEPPHVHDRSDLAVFVLSGAVRMHLGDRVVPSGPGDVIFVPRGAPHWAENAGAGPSFAYVVFTPAFDGKDRRPVGAPAPSDTPPPAK